MKIQIEFTKEQYEFIEYITKDPKEFIKQAALTSANRHWEESEGSYFDEETFIDLDEADYILEKGE